MEKVFVLFAATVLGLAGLSVHAQFGPAAGKMPGPNLNGAISQLFGEVTAFSASMEVRASDPRSFGSVTMPGQLAFLEGKSRFAMDLVRMKGTALPPNVAAQLHDLGMSEMALITRPDKKLVYLVYPGLQSYAEQPLPAGEAAGPDAKFKVDTTALGKETVDGHPCVKNKVVVTDAAGKKNEFTVCNATDLKSFPLRIEINDGGQAATLNFTELKMARPDAGLFEPPKDFTRYDSPQAMMMKGMTKMLGGGGGAPK